MNTRELLKNSGAPFMIIPDALGPVIDLFFLFGLAQKELTKEKGEAP